MSFDLIFLSRKPIDHAAIVKAARKWAARNPYFTITGDDDFPQLSYDNPDTFVHGMFDIGAPEPKDEEDGVNAFPNLHRTGCSANFNYMRPAFFSDELVPLAVEFAKNIEAVLYDPQDDVVLEPDEFAANGSYLRHLSETNARFVRNPQEGVQLQQEDGTLLQAFWRQNVSKEALQEKLGPTIFVPTMLLLHLNGEPKPTTAFTWTRALPLAFEQTGVVLLQREVQGWFKTSAECSRPRRPQFVR